MKILIANDTFTHPHIGCKGVGYSHAKQLGELGHKVVHRYFAGSLAINQYDPKSTEEQLISKILETKAISEKINEVDAIIVNGEGTIHHGSGKILIALLGAGIAMNKKTVLVNTVFQEFDFFKNTLSKLDIFFVRDLFSKLYANSLGLRAEICADSFLQADFDQNLPANLTFGSKKILASDWHHQRTSDSGRTIINFLSQNSNSAYFPLLQGTANLLWRYSPKLISNSPLFISARHHGICLAMKAGIPFIGLGSNTHKIESTVKMLGLSNYMLESQKNISQDLINDAIHSKSRFLDAYSNFLEKYSFNPFTELGIDKTAVDPEREIQKLYYDYEKHTKFSPLKESLQSLHIGSNFANGLLEK